MDVKELFDAARATQAFDAKVAAQAKKIEKALWQTRVDCLAQIFVMNAYKSAFHAYQSALKNGHDLDLHGKDAIGVIQLKHALDMSGVCVYRHFERGHDCPDIFQTIDGEMGVYFQRALNRANFKIRGKLPEMECKVGSPLDHYPSIFFT